MQGMGNIGDRVAVLQFDHYNFDVSMTVIGFIKPAISATQPFLKIMVLYKSYQNGSNIVLHPHTPAEQCC